MCLKLRHRIIYHNIKVNLSADISKMRLLLVVFNYKINAYARNENIHIFHPTCYFLAGPVNALLSWRAIIPLSRLTYCAYLVHPVIMYVYYFSQRTLMRWYDLELVSVAIQNKLMHDKNTAEPFM